MDEADLTTRSYFETQVFVSSSSIEAIRSVVANGNAVTILREYFDSLFAVPEG